MYDSAINLLKKINSFGYEAYMVGGYPRDLYLKRSFTDVDICTSATPMQLKQIFNENIMTHTEYGSVTLIFENTKFEITTFRKDLIYNDGRRPSKIEYVDTLNEDIQRRDFTINTLCIDKDGNQIDLIGAKKDMDAKIIKMIGDPKQRLKEDVLRILRAIRFATILNFELDPKLKKYIKKYRTHLKRLSNDRKKEELDIIFTSPNKEYGIKLLIELKLIDYLDIPKLKKIKITPSAIVTWEELDVLGKFNFSSAEKETIIKLSEVKNKNLLDKKVLYEYGLYICVLAGELTGADIKQINKIYAGLKIKNKLDIEIEPLEICEILNKEAGSFLKEIIDDLEDKIINEELDNNKESLKKYIENKYKAKSN